MMRVNVLWIGLALSAVACGPPRSIDGSGNNPFDPDLGSTESQLRRVASSDYGDGVSTLAGVGRPSARWVSNTVHAQAGSIPNAARATDYLWQWGQFLDHDIDLTPAHDPAEEAPILMPPGDPFFDPFATGSETMALLRSIYDPATGTGPGNPRQQLNLISAWIDASNVYGSDATRASALRTNDGTGRLATSAGDLLPFNTAGLANAGGPDPSLFLAGDVRANEQNALTAMHTLFMREHNRVVGQLAASRLSGDQKYEAGRKWVGALIQSITFNEYLPALLGPYAPSSRSHYDVRIDARIANEFSTAAFRMGHSQLNSTLLRLDANGDEIASGHLALADAFFNPAEITAEGIEPLLRGLASQRAQAIDVHVVDGVRNFLFGPPGAGGLDLASLNIQRGRDHGLPSYNDARVDFGLAPAANYADISSDADVQARLEVAYGAGNVDLVDLWTGGLAEDPLPGAHTGELITAVLVEQFEALRDGDRHWYRRDLHPLVRSWVEATTLADVIRNNTPIGFELQDDVFHMP